VRRHILVLGDQLTRVVGPLATCDPASTVLLVIEAMDWGRRRPYHRGKLVLVWAAMRHFASDARAAGLDVREYRVERFEDGLRAHLAAFPGATIEVMEPADHGVGDGLAAVVAAAGGRLERLPNALWLSDDEAFDRWASGRRQLRMEHWYRLERRRTGWLMVRGDGSAADPGAPDARPAGGAWNYDAANRRVPPAGTRFPAAPAFPPDPVTAEVIRMVDARFADHPGSTAGFAWPVTRADALRALASFVDERLRDFGPYEDAMVDGERVLAHSLLSAVLNLGLLTAREACEAALAAFADPERRADPTRAIPLSSTEGFVRQLLGWREFLRQAYRTRMPGLREANPLGHALDLPAFYWTGATRMRCLGEAIRGVLATGHAHHIQRLMVLGNWAMLAGVDPREVNDWFLELFVDAFDWVVTPNVMGMSQYADPGFTSKPYVAGGAYIDRMSDHCRRCPYDPRRSVGADACPFTTLYWDFVDRHHDLLASDPRLAVIAASWRRRDDGAKSAIRDRAAAVRTLARAGTL
jgi:deoxyribodipyrimidine photolyase-related protein